MAVMTHNYEYQQIIVVCHQFHESNMVARVFPPNPKYKEKPAPTDGLHRCVRAFEVSVGESFALFVRFAAVTSPRSSSLRRLETSQRRKAP